MCFFVKFYELNWLTGDDMVAGLSKVIFLFILCIKSDD